jgi:hypothetical protein
LGGTNPGNFVLSNDTCTGASVNPGSSCTVQASFVPTTTGLRSATIDIVDNAPGSPHHIALNGTGT